MRLPRGAPGALGDRRRRKKEIHFVGTKCCMDESRVAAYNVVLGSLWGWHRNGGQCWVSFIAFLMGEAQRVPCGAINRMARAKTRTKTSPASSPCFMDVQIGVQEEHLLGRREDRTKPRCQEVDPQPLSSGFGRSKRSGKT